MASRWQLCVQFDQPEIWTWTSRSRDEHVRAQPTGRFLTLSKQKKVFLKQFIAKITKISFCFCKYLIIAWFQRTAFSENILSSTTNKFLSPIPLVNLFLFSEEREQKTKEERKLNLKYRWNPFISQIVALTPSCWFLSASIISLILQNSWLHETFMASVLFTPPFYRKHKFQSYLGNWKEVLRPGQLHWTKNQAPTNYS